MAKQGGAKALLITSTPQATGFWLKHLSNLKDSEKFTTPGEGRAPSEARGTE